jgi:hypothetical protein
MSLIINAYRAGTAAETESVTFSDVQLLVNAETQGATSADFIDASSFARTITRHGGVRVIRDNSAGVPKFGSWGVTTGDSSARNDWSVGAAADWKFLHDGTTPWTLDFWADLASIGATQTLIDTTQGSSNNSGIYIGYTTGGAFTVLLTRSVNSSYVVNGTTSGTISPTGAVQHFIRITYDHSLGSANMKFFANGSSLGSLNKTANAPNTGNPSTALRFFGFSTSGLEPMVTSMDEIRVVNGYALSGTYVPSAAFPTS